MRAIAKQQIARATAPIPIQAMAGQVLADAVERALAGTPMEQALLEAADNAARIVVDAAPSTEASARERARELLETYGYEPREDEGNAPGVRLSNCPYDRLAADHRALVCPMNHEFVAAVLRHVGGADLATATVEPGAGCCVRIVASDPSPA